MSLMLSCRDAELQSELYADHKTVNKTFCFLGWGKKSRSQITDQLKKM